jgi:hypothetical protein
MSIVLETSNPVLKDLSGSSGLAVKKSRFADEIPGVLAHELRDHRF